jgi:hypothetical protein
VWLARDERSARDVALKVVPREGKAGSRAEREVEAATRLRHPRCVRALAFERDDEHVYVAYEYVPGKTLRQALRDGELDDERAVEAAAQLLEALAHAHARGIVHRDVKPANVMLEDGDGVSTRLLDFGLAQLVEADTITAAGDVPGTLAYMAPERLRGAEATNAADVWAVGLVLWEALAGWHPFAAGTASPVETAKRIARGAPPLDRERPDLPRALCAAVDAMLSPDPGRRPSARRAAALLRVAAESRARRRRPALSKPVLVERAPHALLAGTVAAAATWLLPFFPAGWPYLLGGLAALAAFCGPRVGLVAALAVPVLPLGNISAGLAVVYAALAALWLVAFAGDPRSGLVWAAGAVLAPLGALPLVAVLAARAAGTVRRALAAAGAVLAAVAVAGLTSRALPFTGEGPPPGLGIAASDTPSAVAGMLLSFLLDRPALAVEAAVLAAAAAFVPAAVKHGPWGASLWGSAFLAASVLGPLAVGAGPAGAFPLALSVWAAAAAVAFRARATAR